MTSQRKGAISMWVTALWVWAWCATSHAASQSRPSTIAGVPVVSEAVIITAVNVGWVMAMGALTFLSLTHLTMQ